MVGQRTKGGFGSLLLRHLPRDQQEGGEGGFSFHLTGECKQQGYFIPSDMGGLLSQKSDCNLQKFMISVFRELLPKTPSQDNQRKMFFCTFHRFVQLYQLHICTLLSIFQGCILCVFYVKELDVPERNFLS